MIKYFSSYLPHGLKVQVTYPNGKVQIENLTGIMHNTIHLTEDSISGKPLTPNMFVEPNDFGDLKPILKTFEFLQRGMEIICRKCDGTTKIKGKHCKQCWIGKEKIIPAIEIAKISLSLEKDYNKYDITQDSIRSIVVVNCEMTRGTEKDRDYVIEIAKDNHRSPVWTVHSFNRRRSQSKKYKMTRIDRQFAIFQFLLKHHFDIFGLIEQGKAVAYE